MDPSLYEEHARLEEDHWWFVGRRSILQAVLSRHLPPAFRRQILDAGSGTGGMLPLLSSFGEVRGIEAEPIAVEHCRRTFTQFDVQLGEIPTHLPTDGSLDVITAFDVIEHLDDDVGALEAFRSSLRPEGTIVLTVPALPRLWSDHDVVNGHKRRYVRTSLLEVLARAGFNPVHASYFNTALLPSVAAARLAQRLRRPVVDLRSDLSMASPGVNRLLTRLMSAEAPIVAGRGLPLGVSLVAVASPT